MKDYFSHDYNSRNDKKLVKAFMKFGLESIGAYWCIVEMLYEEGGYLPLLEYERITFELRSNNECIKYLIYDSELFQNDGEKFWSESAIERLKLRYEKSEKARKSIESRWNRKNNTNVIRTYDDRNTNKVKESKVKEIKENINISSLFSSEFSKVWNELLEMPKWKKKPLTAIKKSLSQLEMFDEKFAINLIEKAIAGNYQGVIFSNTESEYLNWKNKSNGQTINNNSKGKLAGTYKAAEAFAREIEEKNRNFVSPLFKSE